MDVDTITLNFCSINREASWRGVRVILKNAIMRANKGLLFVPK